MKTRKRVRAKRLSSASRNDGGDGRQRMLEPVRIGRKLIREIELCMAGHRRWLPGLNANKRAIT